jgi:formylglycine-generating enzyme required for sulfatase activity
MGACGWPGAETRAEAEGAPPSSADRPELPGFRADAWFLPDEDLLGFVEVPAGPFAMGSDAAVDRLAYDNELWKGAEGPGTVDVPGFYIGRYEVTVAQYRAFVEATGYPVAPQALEAPSDHPVTWVSWPDALSYCRWLEARLRESPHTPPQLSRALRDGFRLGLPSEAEWEKGARGTDGRIFPWGNAPRPDLANYGGKGTMPVGSFECPACPFGLRDMSGNVWELTRSPYQPYPYDPTDDRDPLEGDALFVMRGGHFGDAARNVRAAVRGGVDPGARRPFIGFRVAVSRF